MKVTLNWLKQYVDFDWTPEELTERLTMLGLEVEGVEEVGGGFDGIVVAEVITRDKHPDADKLSVCKVNDGEGERQIVCGADNFQAGDKVPLILPGATLPPKDEGEKPFTIKVGKIRGVESHGMMCAPSELGLAVSAEAGRAAGSAADDPEDSSVQGMRRRFCGRRIVPDGCQVLRGGCRAVGGGGLGRDVLHRVWECAAQGPRSRRAGHNRAGQRIW